MTRREQATGKAGEEQAASALRRFGCEMVEKIGTPVRLIPAKITGTYKVIFGEKVSGDHRAILPGGRSVLAETKTILERNLTWSDLREHQPERLDQHADCGGLSLLVWVSSGGVFIMQWPIDGFGPGIGITIERAQELAIDSYRYAA